MPFCFTNSKHGHKGFAMTEVMIGAAFTGVALAGAFALAGTVGRVGEIASLRQQLHAVAFDILEEIQGDTEHADIYDVSLAYDNTQCRSVAPRVPTDMRSIWQKWCLMLNDASPWHEPLIRSIHVAPIEDEPYTRVVTVALQGSINGALTEAVAQRIVDVPR